MDASSTAATLKSFFFNYYLFILVPFEADVSLCSTGSPKALCMA